MREEAGGETLPPTGRRGVGIGVKTGAAHRFCCSCFDTRAPALRAAPRDGRRCVVRERGQHISGEASEQRSSGGSHGQEGRRTGSACNCCQRAHAGAPHRRGLRLQWQQRSAPEPCEPETRNGRHIGSDSPLARQTRCSEQATKPSHGTEQEAAGERQKRERERERGESKPREKVTLVSLSHTHIRTHTHTQSLSCGLTLAAAAAGEGDAFSTAASPASAVRAARLLRLLTGESAAAAAASSATTAFLRRAPGAAGAFALGRKRGRRAQCVGAREAAGAARETDRETESTGCGEAAPQRSHLARKVRFCARAFPSAPAPARRTFASGGRAWWPVAAGDRCTSEGKRGGREGARAAAEASVAGK